METLSVASRPGAVASSEAPLIRAAQQQDHEAFEQLVRLHDRRVLRLAMSLLRSEEDARDAYQDAFMRVYRNLGAFSFQSSFHTWLYRIVTNVCLDMLRRRKVRKELPAADDGDELRPSVLDQVSDRRAVSNPEKVLRGRELGASIELALDRLTAKERLVFELRHYEGLRLRVIGDVLSISEEAAKNCLFRATQKLRSALKDVRP